MARVTKTTNARAYGFIGVVVMHVLIIWGLKAGLATSLVELIKGPMETKLIEEEQIEKVAPPPPPPKYQALPPAAVIPVDIAVEAPTETGARTIDTRNTRKVENVATVPPRSNPRRPVSQPDYPPTSKRLGEAGTVVMLLTVNEAGRVIEASIDKSSGYDRLDQAALQEARRAWRLLPGTVGGKPTTMQYKFAVTFKITD